MINDRFRLISRIWSLLDFLRNYTCLLKSLFLASLSLNFKANYPRSLLLFLLFTSLSCLSPNQNLFSQEPGESAQEMMTEPVEKVKNSGVPASFSLIAKENSIMPGRSLWLALHVELKYGWHSFWKNAGDCGMPMEITWNLPEGLIIEDIQWPCPMRFDQKGLIGYGYENKATILARLKLSKISPRSLKTAKIEAEVRWLACSDSSCVPGDTELSIELPVLTTLPTRNQANEELFKNAEAEIPKRWSVSAHQQNELIEIELIAPSSALPHFSKAYFFPETKDTVDEKTEPVLVSNPMKPDRYVLILKKAENSKAIHLKGVIVLISESVHGNANVSIGIDIDIERSEEDASVGMVDIKTLKNHRSIKLEASGSEGEFQGGIALALVFAFLGGLILNLMPCVFPVISFKILSFVNMSGKNRKTTLLHGLAFAFGVLVSFWLFAGMLLLLKSYGHEAGWGFQLQQPLFVAFLAALLFIFALSLFGLFEFGVSVSALAGAASLKTGTSSSAIVGSFFSGMLATALATPCTGPFMAPALGFAATLPPISALAIFTFLGLGMAFPYLILSAFPQLLRFLPKPGAWMTTFKELMGFLMLITVLWLISVFAAETSTLGLLMLLTGLLILAMGSWIYGRCCLPAFTRTKRTIGALLTGLFALSAVYVIVASSSFSSANIADNNEHSEWESFSLSRLNALRAEGRPVFIDFTAKWCLICQANHLVLCTDEVTQKLKESNVVKMKADWTRSDPEITTLLREFGRNGVPLYVLYGSQGSEAQVLPQLLTPGVILKALENI